VCGTSGMCLPDMMADIVKERNDITLPSCIEPIFREGCQRFCNCKSLGGSGGGSACMAECRSWFFPEP
jgi:hypothetical protein